MLPISPPINQVSGHGSKVRRFPSWLAAQKALVNDDATCAKVVFVLVRHRFGWKQFCCKACLDKYLSDTTREAQRSKHWLEFLVGKR